MAIGRFFVLGPMMPTSARVFRFGKSPAPRHHGPDGEYRAKTKPWYGTAAWRKRRDQCLRDAKYLCAIHMEREGRPVAATVADHIEPHRGDPAKFWNGTLQALCSTCHNSTKKRMENQAAQST